MPTPSRKDNPHPPLRRVVDFDIGDSGARFSVLSCGHKLREDGSRPRKINGHARCPACLAEGHVEAMAADRETSQEKPRFCTRCGCRLRRGQKNTTCDPCGGR